MKTSSYFDFFQFSQIRSGAGSRSIVPGLVQELGGKRPVLFADKGLTAVGLTAKLQAAFERIPGIQLVGTFDDIGSDAKATDINKALAYYKEVNGDTLIALGGGSVQDTVKGVKWSLEQNISDISLFVDGNLFTNLSGAKKFSTPHIALPTTAGTGSEVSPGAVVYNERVGMKCNIFHPYISADIAVLDPDLTVGLPAILTSTTGMDALTHAVEGYFSPSANTITDAYTLEAIRIIRNNLETATHEGTNIAARAKMLQASSIAIIGFCAVDGPFPVHNVAHAFGAKYHIPHGLANAVLLAPIMTVLKDLYVPKALGFAEALGINVEGKSDEEALFACIGFIQEYCAKLDLPTNFKQYDIKESDLPEIIKAVHNDPLGMAFRIPEMAIEYITKQVI